VELSKYLKENGIKIIIGGVHATFLPYQTLRDSNADYVICGEGEIPLLKLLNNNMKNFDPETGGGGGGGFKGVYSLSNLNSDTMNIQKADVIENLDVLPFPDWEQMAPNAYPKTPFGVFVKNFPVGIIFSSRGCPYSCKFCSSPAFCNKKIRFRSPDNVVKEIVYLVEKFKVREIQFLDDNITMKREHIEQICNLIIANDIKISWSCPNGIRADKVDDDLIKLMKKAGCYYTALGIESANEKILKNIDKKESIETIRKAIKIITSNGIICMGFFILGLPGETKETIQETINFALTSGLDRISFAIFDVTPGSDLWDELAGEYTIDFSKKSRLNPTWIPAGLTKEEIVSAQGIAVKKFYANPVNFFKNMSYIKPVQILYLVKRLFEFKIISK
jgi:radical SAM superfamily enzyme YgiQ (UPF0313 family)